MKNSTVITNSAHETEKLGEQFTGTLQPGDVVFLVGNLGSGKTTFTKGVAKGLGINKRIISPTFIIVRTYTIQLKSQSRQGGTKVKTARQNPKILYHIDLYRLRDEKDIIGVDLREIIGNKEAVTVIEWPEQAQEQAIFHTWEIVFDLVGKNSRKISIKHE